LVINILKTIYLETNNICKICNSTTKFVFNTKLLKKYDVNYYQCKNCDFVQTEKTYWLEEAYQNPINYTDTGIMLRNQRSSKIATSLIFLFFNKNEKFLDYAGGYGVFTRIMRDIGFDFYWHDPYTKNLLSRGFEQNQNEKYHLITTFECFEHFDNPILEIEKILKISKNVIFSTELVPVPLPKPEHWWYYGTEHGQHIALYSTKTLKIIAKKFGVNYYNISNLHVFSETKKGFFGTAFLKLKYSKHILYLLYFVFSLFMKSKTMDDMNNLKGN
jgi:hypothetical protein